ncbi:uncharacterized protein LOC120349709 [Nilaparvata lugens]|uniref:uncharacterized protein LOC120349709 n=1 Tax=Nilaparvata lugens TaxID=108931 RepID=UPI00193E66E5|nr:uncharacterized protein LOC120349709 [Nilaparvata lugens]
MKVHGTSIKSKSVNEKASASGSKSKGSLFRKETTTTSSKNDDAIDEPDVNLPSTSGCTGNAVPDQKHQNIRNPITESYEKIASLKEGGDRHSTITLCILFFICKDM